MDRRSFLKRSCGACLVIGAGLPSVFLLSCASLPVYETEIEDGMLKIPVSEFSATPCVLVRSKTLRDDIAVRKNADGSYLALQLRCAHAEYRVTSAGSGYECSAHGSRFDANGEVVRGPAQRRLHRFATDIADAAVRIRLDRRDEH